jgi:SAM-dependent methyltransferase
MIYFWYILLYLIIVIIAIIGFFSAQSFVALFRAKGVPYVPLNKKQLKHIEDYIKVQAKVKLVDLGCGDGRVLRLFEKMGVNELVGYEVNLAALFWGKIKNKIYQSKVKLIYKNFYRISLSDVDVVFCYLLESALQPLKDKFEKELKPGSLIISYAFEIKNWRQPKEIIYTDKENKNHGRIFIYQI